MTINIPSIILWGFLATVVLSTMIAAGPGLGLSRMSISFLLGTIFTPDRNRAALIGFAIHFINGWLFALVYAAAFESMHLATWWLGAAFGAVHGLFVLVVGLPLLPSVHPRMASETYGPTPTRLLQPPGFMALNYGRQTPVISLIAHIAYGAMLGHFYQLAGG